MSKSVVITGASTGIGRACALHLSRRGWKVFAGVRKEDDARSLRDEDARLTPLFIDVTDEASIAAATKTVEEEVGPRLDGLVNNAGVGGNAPLEFVPLDRVRLQFETNVVGMLATIQAFMPALRTARGRIVNVGSVAGRAPALPLGGVYCASKWAVEALSDSLRIELKPHGVHVALVEPGNIATEIWHKMDDDYEELPPEARELYADLLSSGRDVLGLMARSGAAPEKVTRVVEHALSARRPRLRYLVGADARVRVYVEGSLPQRLRDALFLRLGQKGLPAFLKK